MDLVVYGNTTTSFTYNEYVVFLANGTGGFTRQNALARRTVWLPPTPILVDLTATTNRTFWSRPSSRMAPVWRRWLR
jgi:hypothetical protein